ncbi:MAG: DUF45 domain-containing protein, partial [Candidatus Delongbacteria bacterium]|nr:DUF45 domain-containing protein [Candidatus Delongbacteria bacterium]
MKKIHIPDIGVVRLNKHGRARKNFNIRISEDGTVDVSIPPGQSYRDARAMVISIKDKIRKSRQTIKQQKLKSTFFRPGTDFQTRGYRLNIIRKHTSTASYYL